MKIILLTLLLSALSHLHAEIPPAPSVVKLPTGKSAIAKIPAKWKQVLETPLVDEWQALFGTDLGYPARPAESWAQKFVVFEQLIEKSTGGKRVPIYLSPKLAATMLPALEEKKGQLGLPLRKVPVLEVLRYIVNLSGLTMKVTDDGIFLEQLEVAGEKAK